jgi:hypothetical protein
MEKPSIKSLSYRRRTYGLTSLDRANVEAIQKELIDIADIQKCLMQDNYLENQVEIAELEVIEAGLIADMEAILTADAAMFEPLPKIVNKHVTINSFSDEQICSNFRFRNQLQLNQLLEGFEFHNRSFKYNGNRYSGEEVLLAGLFRLSHISRFGDASWQSVFGWDQPRSSIAFKLFLDHMMGYKYLLEDRLQFWKDFLPECAESIRKKLVELGDNSHGCAYEPGGFKVFGFIDNTVFTTCRLQN